VRKADNLPPSCAVVTKSRKLNFLELSGQLGPVTGLIYHFLFILDWVTQWLGCCATNRKVAGSIPAGVSGFFIDISHYGPGVESASNRNEHQVYCRGVKTAGAEG